MLTALAFVVVGDSMCGRIVLNYLWWFGYNRPAVAGDDKARARVGSLT